MFIVPSMFDILWCGSSSPGFRITLATGGPYAHVIQGEECFSTQPQFLGMDTLKMRKSAGNNDFYFGHSRALSYGNKLLTLWA